MPIPMQVYYEKAGDIRAEKKPLCKWKDFQTKRTEKEDLKNLFNNPNAQIAVLTGKQFGILVIDQDIGASEDNISFLNSFNTLVVKTPSGGKHHYFLYPKTVVAIKSRSDVFGDGSHIDVRADGGIAMVPPSKYPNDTPYTCDTEFNKEKMVELPEELLRKITTIEKTEPSQKKLSAIIQGVGSGSRNSDLTVLIGTLLKHMPQESWDTVCLPMIHAVNMRNSPPLGLDEVMRTYESIRSLEVSKRGVGSSKDSILNEAISLDELLKTAFPEARFVVEHLFEIGTISMLSAPPNKWKSWLVILCAICIASSRNFLGKFKTEKQAVLIVNEEDTSRLLQERCNMLMDNPEELPIYFHIGKQIKLTENFVTQLIEEAQKKSIGVIIFDSLRSVHDADENSSKEMQLIMDQLKRITRTGITVLFTHHNRKKAKFNKNKDDSSGEESRGSSAINAGIHGHLSCDEEERDGVKYLVIHQPKLKADEKLKPFVVRIEHDKDNKKMRFIYEGEHQSQEKEFNRTMESLLHIFEETAEGLSLKDFMEMGIGAETTVRLSLKMLVAQGRILAKTYTQVQANKLTIRASGGKHNEKFYFNIKDEVEPAQESLDDW
jgi:hypothetical protein